MGGAACFALGSIFNQVVFFSFTLSFFFSSRVFLFTTVIHVFSLMIGKHWRPLLLIRVIVNCVSEGFLVHNTFPSRENAIRKGL